MAFFKTTAEIRTFLIIDENMAFESLLPVIKDAEKKFIKPLLGELYTSLLADYTDKTDAFGVNKPAPDNMLAANLLLLPFVQNALAKYALYVGVEYIGVSVGDQGIQQTFGQNSQPAPRWKIRDLKSSYITQADDAAEELLKFLEETASVTVYNSWYADIIANSKMSGLIVNSTRIASKYIDINESRRMFLKLKKAIENIEAGYIKRLICFDQYDELVTQLKTGTLTANNEKLVFKLEPIIAKKALYETLAAIKVKVSPEGLHLLSVSDSSIVQQPANVSEINELKCALKDGDLGYMQDEEAAKKFISDNILIYPLIAASSCYSATAVQTTYVADNDSLNKHFSV